MHFLVLNYADHTFKDFDFPEQAIKFIQSLENTDEICIAVTASDREEYLDTNEFLAKWS